MLIILFSNDVQDTLTSTHTPTHTNKHTGALLELGVSGASAAVLRPHSQLVSLHGVKARDIKQEILIAEVLLSDCVGPDDLDVHRGLGRHHQVALFVRP